MRKEKQNPYKKFKCRLSQMRVAVGSTTIVASGYSGEFFAYLFCGKKVGPCRGSDGEDERWQKK